LGGRDGKGRARLLTVKVQARSKLPGVEALGPDEFWVRVRAVPEKGRANREVAQRLAAYLGVSPSLLTLVRGASSSHKQFRLES
jgi:uncharacterized protein YggU (UPF0235/DUF167 family)